MNQDTLAQVQHQIVGTAPVNLGIIGLGDFGREHLRAALRTPGVRVASIADTNESHAAAMAVAYGIPHWYSDPEHLMRAGDVDGVVIVTPARYHLPLTQAAVDRSIGVLVEKPVIHSLDQAAGMLACARRGLVLPAHILRFMEPYQNMHAELTAPGAPMIGGLSARRHRSIDHIYRFPEHDPILMTMIHDIDQALWMTDTRAVSVSATATSVRGGKHADLVLATVRDEQDRIWEFGASWLLEGDVLPDWFEVYTDRGIRVANSGERLDLGSGLVAEISHFADCIAGSRPSQVVSVEDAVHGISIASSIRRSSVEGGRTIDVV